MRFVKITKSKEIKKEKAKKRSFEDLLKKLLEIFNSINNSCDIIWNNLDMIQKKKGDESQISFKSNEDNSFTELYN